MLGFQTFLTGLHCVNSVTTTATLTADTTRIVAYSTHLTVFLNEPLKMRNREIQIEILQRHRLNIQKV